MKRIDFHLDYTRKRGIIIAFAVVLLLMIYFFKSSSMVLRVLTAISSMLLFYVIDHFYNIKFRKRHYVFMFVIIIMGVMMSPLYFVYHSFDKIQHLVSPILLSSILFFMINKIQIELKWKIVFTFFVTFAILGLFEIGEFTMDSLFDLKLQGVYLRDLSGIEKFNLVLEPLKDTMIDLVLGLFGTLIYCLTLAMHFRKKLDTKIFKEM